MSDGRQIWVRARAFSTGMEWVEVVDDGAQPAGPPEPMAEIVAPLDTDRPSLAIGRSEGRLVVAISGFPTAQTRINAPNTTTQIVVADIDDVRGRQLAARILVGLGNADDTNVAARLSQAVTDGPDTTTFGVDWPDEALDGPSPPVPPVDHLPAGTRALSAALLAEIAGALASGAELPADGLAVVLTSEERLSTTAPTTALVVRQRHGDDEPLVEPATDNPAGDESGRTADHAGPDDRDDLSARLLPRRVDHTTAARVAFDAMFTFGVVASVLALAVGLRALLDLADRLRVAAGSAPPTSGRDWYIIVVVAVLTMTVLGLLVGARQVVRRRFQRRLLAVMGPQAKPLARASRWLDRGRLIDDLLVQPLWDAKATEWRASGDLLPARSSSSTDHDAAARLIAGEIQHRVGQRALATGLAVAAARSRVGDAAAVVAGSAEIQLDVLASLGLRPSVSTYYRVVRTAAAGITAATFLDIEDRMELELAVRAGVLGLDALGDASEAVHDALDDDIGEIVGETLAESGGAIGSAASGVVGGAFGLTGSVVRQVADLTEAVGAQVTEGLVVAAMLHHHGSTLAADVLVGRDSPQRAEIVPSAGHVPRELFDVAVEIARRQRRALRKVLRQRVGSATRSAPRFLWDRVRNRSRS